MGCLRTIRLASEEEMNIFGARLGAELLPGTAVLLSGPIGVGKTHLARAMIRALLPDQHEIPSPTYTLVQTYQADGIEIWHADLYRLADSSELVELGLDEAFDTAIVILEWPDRLPEALRPSAALSIDIALAGETRQLTLSAKAGAAAQFLSRLEHA